MNNENVQSFVDGMINTHLVKQVEFIKNVRMDHYFAFEDLTFLNLHILNKSRKEIDVRNFMKSIDTSIINRIYKEDVDLYDTPTSTF